MTRPRLDQTADPPRGRGATGYRDGVVRPPEHAGCRRLASKSSHGQENTIATPEHDGFSIGELAKRTGVPAATLRTWETRYGQPQALPRNGGHRRYGEDAVEAVEQILRQRAAGMNMEAAVSRLAPDAGQRYPSVFAMLREQHPELATQRLSKSTLLALTHAVEDEYLARAEKAVLFGFFQKERFYRGAQGRWDELALAADFACVVADFEPTTQTGQEEQSPMLVALSEDSPMRREWLLLCDSPGVGACVAGWERPGPYGSRSAEREYEVIWTMDATVVRDVARACVENVEELTPARRQALEARLADEPAQASADLKRANAMFRRVLDYVDARS